MKRLRMLLVILVCAVAIGPHALMADGTIQVDIDIKPGSDTNCLNNDGHGVIPVAILGSEGFDVHNVNAATVELEGLAVAVRGKSDKLLAAYEDVNGDGYMDLVLKIEDSDGALTEGSTAATLTGWFVGSNNEDPDFAGTDDICIVPPLPGPDAPTAADDAYSTDEDTQLTVAAPGVLGNDSGLDGDSPSAVLDTGPSNGTLTLNEDGSFTYTPDADYHGIDSFTYHASDGTLDSDIATVTITVNPVTEPPTQATVFVTSQTYTGATLGGLVGADAICQGLANDAGLEGTYKAWLSSSSVDARDRLIHSDVPYVRTDGTQIADNWADLVDGTLDYPISVDENGQSIVEGGYNHWALTATGGNGTCFADSDCLHWTGDDGYPVGFGEISPAEGSTYLWTYAEYGGTCTQQAHLYCFQQVIADPVTVFVTSQTYTGATLGGLWGGDAICQDLATGAGLEGTYKAWLSSADVDARDRLYHSDIPYARTDGTLIAISWNDLVDGTLDYPISVDENGQSIVEGGYNHWALTATGGNGTCFAGSDCLHWTGDDGYPVGFGEISPAEGSTYLWTYAEYGGTCTQQAHLYCFEQVVTGPSKTVFITSQTYTGATLGGLDGADAECQASAEAAGLEGTYKAWLSSSVANARDRLTHSDDPYLLTDGTQIADNWTDLVDGSLDSELNRTEWNQPLTTDHILTASWNSGVYNQAQDCYGWTDNDESWPISSGDNYYTATWSDGGLWTIECDGAVHLYCFEQ